MSNQLSRAERRRQQRENQRKLTTGGLAALKEEIAGQAVTSLYDKGVKAGYARAQVEMFQQIYKDASREGFKDYWSLMCIACGFTVRQYFKHWGNQAIAKFVKTFIDNVNSYKEKYECDIDQMIEDFTKQTGIILDVQPEETGRPTEIIVEEGDAV